MRLAPAASWGLPHPPGAVRLIQRHPLRARGRRLAIDDHGGAVGLSGVAPVSFQSGMSASG
jgi:hypothetical protein